MSIFKKIVPLIDKTASIVDQAVVDKDKQIELHNTLETLRTQLMLSGSGAGVTKITICFLVSMVVITGTVMYVTGGDMNAFKDYALSVTPVIGILIGVYGGGKALTTKWGK